ncbi:PAS domain S-box protein [Mucilaginibacter limnophilus]|uniref:PAS domain S-box protein n=1 Tax=Mucilaginibacter limnophilus TaxID=1932778 RepID=A0A437MV78_9SPHI|nr:PAS domain S-box protein [Mucilaginibacter limnophilus]RVU01574.1 PAS domain S-box protein [Mucilaginibacter limnophilus]
MPYFSSDNQYDLALFFDLFPDMMCIAGNDGYFKKINPAFTNTLGYSSEELLSKPINSFIYPDDQNHTLKVLGLIEEYSPVLNFENRYIAKSGEIIWLVWTSIKIECEGLVFATAKDITYRKKLEEYHRIALIINKQPENISSVKAEHPVSIYDNLSPADQRWLDELEKLIRKYTGKVEVTIGLLSYELAVSERQLYRRIKSITGITPNKYIRIIKLQIAHEAIKTGKYRTVNEISYAAGFETPAYFNKLFKEVYNLNVLELL